MEIFYHVVEQQSFSKAAERLGVSKSFISKRITKLEKELQVSLLSRSTRKLTLTEAGESFYRYCVNVVQEGESGYSMIRELQGKPSGRLRMSIPPALGLNLLSPVFSKYLKRYPDVTLDVDLESRLVDSIKEGYDLVLRSAVLESSNLIAQKIYTIKNIVCATSNYLKDHENLKAPDDLINHNCAVYSDAKAIGQIKFQKQDQVEIFHVKGSFMSNQLNLIKKIALSDNCLAILPEFMVISELRNKELIPVLDEYALPTNDLYAVYPEKKFMLPRLSLFLKMLKDFLQKREVGMGSEGKFKI